jgi:hypothetical protein
MQAIEISGSIDENGELKTFDRLNFKNKKVKIIVLFEDDEIENNSNWLKAASENPAFQFLSDPQEDIYTHLNGKRKA